MKGQEANGEAMRSVSQQKESTGTKYIHILLFTFSAFHLVSQLHNSSFLFVYEQSSYPCL